MELSHRATDGEIDLGQSQLVDGAAYGSLAPWERWLAKQDGEGVKWSPLIAPPTVKLILGGGTWSTARFYGDGFLIAPPTVKFILDKDTWSTARRYKNAEI